MRSKNDAAKKLKNIGTKLSDFEEIKDGTKGYTILGKGNFGYAEKMKSKKDNKIYAIKKIDKNSPLFKEKDFIRETEIMFLLNQDNIIKLYGYFEDKESLNKFKEIYKGKKNEDELNKLKDNIEVYCLVLEFAKNGSLRDFTKNKVKNRSIALVPIEENEIIRILKQLLSGLKHMHEKGVMHRDITPDNILLDEKNNVKITDFGISAIHKDSKTQNKKIDEQLFSTKTIVGRIAFSSPQVQSGAEYDCSCDIYSLGLTILYMMSYDNPISVKKIGKDEEKKRYLKVENMHKKYNEYLKNLILRMIKDKPELRPTASDAYDELEVIEIFKDKKNNKIFKRCLEKANKSFVKDNKIIDDVKPDPKTFIYSQKKMSGEDGFNSSNNIYSNNEKAQNLSKSTIQPNSINTNFPQYYNYNVNNNTYIYNNYQTYNTNNYNTTNIQIDNAKHGALRASALIPAIARITNRFAGAFNNPKKI